ncbi:unnamed protein product [Ostreobium quekettii]|uniref:Uncharacterized protein n=1 Tax=Ostreobium quekettii TaxID=121088 RepID=A0A8S1J6K1_9CHLO|nr:unnamed protein product [Ostreobium quekettii]
MVPRCCRGHLDAKQQPHAAGTTAAASLALCTSAGAQRKTREQPGNNSERSSCACPLLPSSPLVPASSPPPHWPPAASCANAAEPQAPGPPDARRRSGNRGPGPRRAAASPMACASSRNRGCHGTEKIRWKLAAWGVLMVALSAAGDSDNLGRRIRANEDIVRTLQEAATELYATRGQVVPGCSCSVHACSNEFPPGRECSDKLGHSEEICGGCEEKGRMLDLLKSMVRTPPGEDPEKLSPEVIESICTFQPLDKDFVAKGPDGNYTWTYIGTTTGVHRVWPGLAIVRGLPDDDPEQPLGSCRKFDPRERPWFNAASSGPKDVVIVLDTSTSMGETLGSRGKTRWEVTKDATSRLLGTFGISDFVSIVTFNSEAEVLGGRTTLVRADNANVEMLRREIGNVELTGKTNFKKGFQTAFNVLIESSKLGSEVDDPPTSSCTRVILFLTDGEDCSLLEEQSCNDSEDAKEESDANTVADFIREKQSEMVELGGESAHIFTFSMTSDSDDKLAKMIACENNGSWASIEEKDDPLVKFLDYTRFLAWTRRGLDVIWSNFYVDGAGLGNMTTAVMPVYAPETSDGIPGLLIGVVGKDVLVSELEADDADFEDVFKRLIELSSFCRPPEESVCQLQVLRGKESQCPDIIEQRPCFYMDSEKKYYTTVPENKLPFEEAAEACIKLGGHLAEPKSDVAHAFLSSLATREGCWIGLRLGNSPPFRWRWEVSEEEAEQIPRTDPEGSSFWASRAKGANECAAIDRRGRRKNVFDVSCKKEMAFVCEFEATKAPEQCSGNDTERVTEDFVSMVPSIDLCSDYESARLASTSVIDKTLGIVSETAVCPLGTPETSTEEVQCCSCKTAVPKSCGAGVDDPPCVDG